MSILMPNSEPYQIEKVLLSFFFNKCIAISSSNSLENTGYFTTANEPGGIENATHNTFATLTRIF
jgi:hypothetical protein